MTKTEIKTFLLSNDRAVELAMVALYRCQTSEEQHTSTTKEVNGKGFNAFHAENGTYYAKWVLSGKKLTSYHLTRARKMACYYAGQLAAMSVSFAPQATAEPFSPSTFTRITPDFDYVVDTATRGEEGLLDLINTYDVFQGRTCLTLRQTGREAHCS
jgi:hypothetical protein